MLSVDTNVVVRLLVRDDEPQYEKSRALFADSAIYLTDTVLLETEWVLRFAYELDPPTIMSGLRKLLGLPNVTVADELAASRAIKWCEEGLDFADAFHLSLSRSAKGFKTFDRKLIKRSKSLLNHPVGEP